MASTSATGRPIRLPRMTHNALQLVEGNANVQKYRSDLIQSGAGVAPTELQRHIWGRPYPRVGLTTAAITALATVQVKNVSAIPA